MSDLPAPQPQLKRVLTLPLITLYGIGGIVGAGIYVLIGKIVGTAGLLAPFSFIVAAAIALFSALTYAELSSRFPSSGGEVTYVKNGFNSNALSLLVGLTICFAGSVSSAAIARGAAAYLQVLVDIDAFYWLVLFVILITTFACWGVLESVGIATLITLIEIGGLLLVCSIGFPNLETLSQYTHDMLPTANWHEWASIFSAALLAFYAYIGFEDMVNMGEEVKSPRRTLPLAILLALGVSTLLYFAVALVFISTVPIEALAQSDAPFATFIHHTGSLSPSFITIISLLAITNGALVQIIMSARILFGMSKHHLIPGYFSRVNPHTRTPVVATLTVSVIVFAFATLLPIESLARLTSYLLLSVFAVVNFALILVKRRLKVTDARENDEYFVIPFWIPCVGFCLCLTLLLTQLI